MIRNHRWLLTDVSSRRQSCWQEGCCHCFDANWPEGPECSCCSGFFCEVQTAFTAMYKVMAGGKRAITGRSMRCVGDLLLSKKMMVLGGKKNKETIFWCGLSKGQQGVYFKKEIRKLQPLCFQVWNFEDMTAVWHIWLHLTSLRCTVFLFHLVLILCDDLRWKNELLSLWIVEL